MTLQVTKREALDYTLVYLLVAISGMPLFDGDIPLLGVFGLAFLVFFLRREGFHRAFFAYIFAFIMILLLHSLEFDYLPLNTYLGFIIKMTVAYLIVAMLKQDFVDKYINIICFFAAISFVFAIPLILSPSFDSIFNSIGVSPPFSDATRKSLIVFQLNIDRASGIFRNCGPFWEPAAFGGYLLLALMFNMARTGKLGGRKNILLIVTLVSTFSTTVYLLLGILVFFHFFVNQSVVVKIMTVPIMAGMFLYAFLNIPFLNEKIMEEVDRGDMVVEMKYHVNRGHTRLSSGFADFNDIKEHPILGRGIFELSFYDPKDTKTRHNGLTKQIAQFGIVGSLLYFIPMFLGFSRLLKTSSLNNAMAGVFLLIIFGMGIAEGYFDKPFFWGLFFLHLVYSGTASKEPLSPETRQEEAYA